MKIMHALTCNTIKKSLRINILEAIVNNSIHIKYYFPFYFKLDARTFCSYKVAVPLKIKIQKNF